MRRRRSTMITGVALCVLLAAGAPRVAEGESLFSMNLVGERVESGDTRAITLGGSSQLVLDSLGVLSLNTAMLTRLGKFTIGATQMVAVDEGRSEFLSEQDISFSFSSFIAAFPLYSGIVLSLGYKGRYDPGGGFTLVDTTGAGDVFNKTFTRSGGLFSIPITGSVKLTRFLSLGLTFSAERGKVEDRWDTVFDDPGFAPSAGIKTETLTGWGYGGSIAMFVIPNVTVGATWESAIDYDSDVRERYTQSSLDTSYTSSVRLPARASVAATWGITRSLQLLGSVAWSDFNTFRGLSFPVERLTMERSLSLGVEWIRRGTRAMPRWPLRASFTYQELPYEHPAGEPIVKYVVGLGTGVTFGGGKGKIDVGIQAGRVGAISDTIVEDRLFRVYFGISGSEKWRRKAAAEL